MKRLIGTLVLGMSFCAHAEFFTGNELYSKMNDTNSYFHQGVADGYIVGVYDALVNVTHCPPRNVTVRQIKDMVRTHIENNPSTRHNTADSIISYVLTNAWPCPKRGSSL